jgi:hypothetical protein
MAAVVINGSEDRDRGGASGSSDDRNDRNSRNGDNSDRSSRNSINWEVEWIREWIVRK